MTINEFCGVNSLYERPDGTKITHTEMYTMIVNKVGLDNCKSFIPATKEQIIEALKTDEYLNNIPVAKWDSAAGYICQGANVVKLPYGFRNVMVSKGFNVLSLSQCVCTLKQAARMWAEEKEI